MKNLALGRYRRIGTRWLLAIMFLAGLRGAAFADVPGYWKINPTTGNPKLLSLRPGPQGTVPNPGTQQQELTNITADMGPAYYNVFEFPVTCMACHGGVLQQQAGHSGNWGGSVMSSAARDPVFRANQITVEKAVEGLMGKAGAGNVCYRCHSPNGWSSGRFDPTMGGAPDGSAMYHTILASTDDEGVMCETCHRAIGNVTMKRPGLKLRDPAWKMLADIDDWPHLGDKYPAGPVAGDPFGEAALQFNDGMTYGATFFGNVSVFFSDIPWKRTGYTGQTYGIYPLGYVDAWGTPRGGQPVVSPDGSTPLHFEYPETPPADLNQQAMSPEHSTFKNDFVRSPEFCGSCHEVTIPFLNNGMPEQRTYTEWKYSAFGQAHAAGTPGKRCQDCHMPRMMHEYEDATRVSLNCDPTVSGWFPFAKNRNLYLDPLSDKKGTPFHKFAGSNFNLPDMMKILYPEVDLEVIGEPTLNDPRLFPGMQSDRASWWDRARNNSQLMLKDAVTVRIVPNSLIQVGADIWQVQVKVINNTAHKIPSGYPDGRRFWISLDVRDAANARLYQSGHYARARIYSNGGFQYARSDSARLYNDSSLKTGLNRALSNNVGSLADPVRKGGYNEVMIYEKRTGNPDETGNFTVSPNELNTDIVFDNRIPPDGWQPAEYAKRGSKFWVYDRVSAGQDDTAAATGANRREDEARYGAGANYDVVTYTFQVPAGKAPTRARAEVQWQIHTRSFLEYLRDSDTSTLRPEGPPIVWTANYPLEPNYLSQDYYFGGKPYRKKLLKFAEISADPFAPPPATGSPATLRDNWGGVAFAAWFRSGLGAPFTVAAADTAATRPWAPSNLRVAGGPNAYTLDLAWDPVADADGYVLWVRYGAKAATATWDRLAVLNGAAKTTFRMTAMNPGKTYGFRVQAFNGAGASPFSVALDGKAAAGGVPLAPEALMVISTSRTWIQLQFADNADNESGFVIQRQEVGAGGPVGPFADRATIAPADGIGVEVRWTDNGLAPGKTYNYRVAAYVAPDSRSTYTAPVQAQTLP